MNNTRDLTVQDLRELANALRSGRLRAPFTKGKLEPFCSRSSPWLVSVELQGLVDDGMPAHHLALLADNIAATKVESPAAEPVDLVWTGPEAPGATNRDTAVVVRELFSNASTEVAVAGYAVYQGRHIFQALADRMEQVPELKVRMYLDVHRRHRDTTCDADLLREFAARFKTADWPGKRFPEIYFDPRSLALDSDKKSSMHAKCIVVDRKVAFISSANFTEAAQTRNIEVGALIRSPHFAEQLVQHFEGLVEARVLVPVVLRPPH